jgi:hypothetical protein
MKHLLKHLLTLITLFTLPTARAQQTPASSPRTGGELRQTVRGTVLDAESRQPLPGVTVTLLPDQQKGTSTDEKGNFVLHDVPVGRQSFRFTLLGFEPHMVSEALVISGKELELNIFMKESLQQLNEVTITAGKERIKAQNEFATLSARSFSVEETRRYAASFADPARMVMNFPGVSNAGDMDNGIVVRGNSPKGVLWRMEGIEIPNPNHFSSVGTSGGAISMLNANVLGNSDFYTGAFPAEFGNALSGVFDLSFRNGNTERREHTVQVGALGVELATEGPFKQGKKASYLVNYRYSTLALLGHFLNFGGMQPEYQDAAFKLNFPTEKAGTFSVFGLGGYNLAQQEPGTDSSKWDEDEGNLAYKSTGMMGMAGVSHQYALDRNSYIRTVISASYTRSVSDADTLDPSRDYQKARVSSTYFANTAYRASVLYNRKINARHTVRTGLIGHQLGYDMHDDLYHGDERRWKTLLSGTGSTQFYQGYLQWKGRMSERVTLGGGLHGSYLALNDKYSIEPRGSVTYDRYRHKFTLATGLHSKPEHISTYFFQNTEQGTAITNANKNLDLIRAFHTVAGYETALSKRVRLKIETYYQHLYNVPVEKDSASGFSLLNAEEVYALMNTSQPLVSEGTGANYGVDLSLERPFANDYYLLGTGSLYKSTYTNYKGERYNTRFNRGYQLNIVGGKEFRLRADGRRIIGLNGKILWSGGMRESVVDLARSVAEGQTRYVPGKYYALQVPAYFRTDAGIYYKINARRATHSIQLDIQNVTNRQNYYLSYFDNKSGTMKTIYQIGILPNISYRIDFHR